MKKVTVDILGSCISRIMLLNGDYSKGGTADKRIEVEYFFDKTNIVSCMMPPPFTKEEVEAIRAEELHDRDRIRILKQGLNKDIVPMLLNGKADYLILDLYDLSTSVACYKDTTFSNCSFEFFRTSLAKKYSDDIKNFNFMDTPTFLWYPYIDLFFEKINRRFDSDHIILVRFHSCKNYLDIDGTIKRIPNAYLKPFHGNFKYNDKIRDLEEYIISKFNPYIIDLSRYFIVDEEHWGNVNGVHYQKLYYEEALKKLQSIFFENKPNRIYDKISNLAVSKILSLNISDDEAYLRYFKEIKYPLVSCNILDNICKVLSYKEIVSNRMILSELYLIAHNIEEKLLELTISDYEKIKIIIEELPFEYKNTYNDFLEFILNFYKKV